jgi:hypothetical protein
MVVFRDSTDMNWNRRRRAARLGQLPEVAGGITAAEVTTRTPAEAISIGVTTGVLVFAITRILDRMFFGGPK